MHFRISGLPAERFNHLFALSEQELAAQGAVRQNAEGEKVGVPAALASPTPGRVTS